MSGNEVKLSGILTVGDYIARRTLQEVRATALTSIGPLMVPPGAYDGEIELGVSPNDAQLYLAIIAGPLPVLVKLNSVTAIPLNLLAKEAMLLDSLVLDSITASGSNNITKLYISNPGAAPTTVEIVYARNPRGVTPGLPGEYENFETFGLGRVSGIGYYGLVQTDLYDDFIGIDSIDYFKVLDVDAYQGSQCGGLSNAEWEGYSIPVSDVKGSVVMCTASVPFAADAFYMEYRLKSSFPFTATLGQMMCALLPLGWGGGGPPLLVQVLYTNVAYGGFTVGTWFVVSDLTTGFTTVLQKKLSEDNILADETWRTIIFGFDYTGDYLLVGIDTPLQINADDPQLLAPIPVWPSGEVAGTLIAAALGNMDASPFVVPAGNYQYMDRLVMANGEPIGPLFLYESFETWAAGTPVIGAGYYGDFLSAFDLGTGETHENFEVIDTDYDSGTRCAVARHSTDTPSDTETIIYHGIVDDHTADLSKDIVSERIAFRFPDPFGWADGTFKPIILGTWESYTVGTPDTIVTNRQASIVYYNAGSNFVLRLEVKDPGDSDAVVNVGDFALPSTFLDGQWHQLELQWDKAGTYVVAIIDKGEAAEFVAFSDSSTYPDIDPVTVDPETGWFMSAATYAGSPPAPVLSDAKPDSWRMFSFGPETFDQFPLTSDLTAAGAVGEYGPYIITGGYGAVAVTDADAYVGTKCAQANLDGLTIPSAGEQRLSGTKCDLAGGLDKLYRGEDNVSVEVYFKMPTGAAILSEDVIWGFGMSTLTWDGMTETVHYAVTIQWYKNTDETWILIDSTAAGGVEYWAKLGDGNLFDDAAWHDFKIEYDYSGTYLTVTLAGTPYTYLAATYPGWVVAKTPTVDRVSFAHMVANDTSPSAPVVIPSGTYIRFDQLTIKTFP